MMILLLLCMIPLLEARQIRWNWKEIKTSHLHFPKDFLWGCADSALQTEGCQTVGNRMVKNSWTAYEEQEKLADRIGKSCERWDRYREDFDLLESTGMNAYRFSIEWSKYEEEEGQFNEAVLDHYEAVVDDLLRRNITPMITLFHHTLPLWMLEKGGFEFQENMHYFVRFAQRVFQRLHHKVTLWVPFNEPVAYGLAGYFRGNYPPCKKNLRLAGTVIANQLSAHISVAQLFKKINPLVKIGITHIFQPIDAYTRINPIENMLTKYLSFLVNQTVVHFFKTGKFWWVKPWPLLTYAKAGEYLDFMGINYYTHTTIKQTGIFKMEVVNHPDDLILAEHKNQERAKVLYAEGLYRSIVRVSKLNIPIYITENGTPTDDPSLKTEFFKRHLYVISRACAEGYDVRGYFYWTLTDCYAWTRGFNNKHGIFAVDFATQTRTLRPAVAYLLDVIQQHNRRHGLLQ